MSTMQQVAQKPRRKFCDQKTAKKRKTHPIWAKKGETGCVSGAGEGCSRYGRVGKPEIRTKMHQIAMQHMKKGNRQKPRVSAGFVAGAEGLGLGCRLGRAWTQPAGLQAPTARGFGVDVETAHKEQERGSVARFPTQVRGRTVLVWCYGKFSGPKRAKKSGKSPKKREILLTKTDTVPIL